MFSAMRRLLRAVQSTLAIGTGGDGAAMCSVNGRRGQTLMQPNGAPQPSHFVHVLGDATQFVPDNGTGDIEGTCRPAKLQPEARQIQRTGLGS